MPHNPDFDSLVRSRRSIFPASFTGEKVEDELVLQMLRNAHTAPTHGKTQPWRFVVFCEKGLKQFAQIQAEKYKVSTPPEQFSQTKYEKLRTHPLKASHVIALIMKRQASEQIPEIEEIAAVACAVQNLALSAHAYGLGGYWSTGGITYHPDTKELFGLSEKDKLMGFFYLGVPVAELPPLWDRGSVEPLVNWVRG